MTAVLVTALRITFLLLAAALAVLGLRRASAASRHIVWSASLLGVLSLLPLSVMLPRMPVALLPASAAVVVPASVPDRVTVLDVGAVAVVPEASVEPSAAGMSSGPAWRVIVAGVWAAGVALFLVRLLVGGAMVRRVVRHARPSPGPVLDIAREASEALGLRRGVRLLESERVAVPVVWGVLRPVILLPPEAGSWAADRLRAVLLHELAHIQRHDCLMHTLAGAAKALYWPHPLVWWAHRRLRAEAEQASDDRVVQAGTRGVDYAQQLLEVARALGRAPHPLAVVAVVERSSLEDRLLSLLDPRRRRGVPSRRARWSVAAVCAALVMWVSAAEPVRRPVFAQSVAAPTAVPTAVVSEPRVVPPPQPRPTAPAVSPTPTAHVVETAMVKGEIAGVVVDAQGQPVSAFTVEALAEPSPSRFVEATQVGRRDGTFRLPLPPATYVLSIRAHGYKLKLSWLIEVKAGQTADAGRLALEVGGVVHGIVTDRDGRPIRGAGVGTVSGFPGHGSNITDAAVTDDAGRFELPGVAPGAARLAAIHDEHATSDPVDVNVDANAANGPVALVLSPGGRIEGVVRGRHGMSSRRVIGRDRFGARRQALVRDDGRFTLEHVTPGVNTLSFWVDHAGAENVSLYSQTVEVREGETASPSIVLGQILMRGRLTAEGKPLARCRVRLQGIGKDKEPLMSLPAVTAEDGAYEVVLLRPGTYVVSIQGERGSPRLRRPPRVDVPEVQVFAHDITLPATAWE